MAAQKSIGWEGAGFCAAEAHASHGLIVLIYLTGVAPQAVGDRLTVHAAHRRYQRPVQVLLLQLRLQ